MLRLYAVADHAHRNFFDECLERTCQVEPVVYSYELHCSYQFHFQLLNQVVVVLERTVKETAKVHLTHSKLLSSLQA